MRGGMRGAAVPGGSAWAAALGASRNFSAVGWGKESAVGVRLLREGILKVVWRRSGENRRVRGPARHRAARLARRDERSCGAGGARAPVGAGGKRPAENRCGGSAALRGCLFVCLLVDAFASGGGFV